MRDLATFAKRGATAVGPFLVVWLASVLAFPRGTFSFDLFGALRVPDPHLGFSGPLYPDAALEMSEVGRLGDEKIFGRPRRISWETDRYGYRKRDTDNQAWDVVIIGNSFIAGDTLSQDEMLSEVLERRTGLRTYPLAPRLTLEFFLDARFDRHPPTYLIICHLERSVAGQRPIDFDVASVDPPALTGTAARAFGTYMDFIKLGVLHKTRARLEDAWHRWVDEHLTRGNRGDLFRRTVVATDRSMVFYQGEVANFGTAGHATTPQQADATLTLVENAAAAAKKRGTTVIYSVIPNKENVYYDRLPSKRRPTFIAEYQLEARARGLHVVDLEAALHEARERSDGLLYHPNDTHWTPPAVRAAARAFEEMIERLEGR